MDRHEISCNVGLLLVAAALTGCTHPVYECGIDCLQAQRRAEYIMIHPELDDRIAASIADGRVLLGMTPEQVIAAIGLPDEKITVAATVTDREQWVYHKPDAPVQLFFFKFGRLNGWTRPVP